ncbi:SDR family NAD(P)-dependent oxidoreductase [Streptomyces meridianus]|uniref:SDR family NAD(P)-dependent oxidoreductase n=1 Tax=Streptomyces meridianus TaxID=2938945 RepID=A0ABT0X3R5_9ACTN|nr:SDR family NAD(P)-dependent oxidoreductase [Streptomyces meridianus]MCM2577182.1 SDR family NAD(P)-dependent oxidoreductase [Streptomyces meridianus]
MPASELQGLSAVVTGGSRGLGLLLARELGRAGCDVTIAARDGKELAAAAGLLAASHGVQVRTLVCDVRDRDAVHELMAQTAARAGGVDVVLANAGVIQVGPVGDGAVGVGEFRNAMETMFFGALHTSLEALPYLRRSPAGGRLALTGSIGGLMAVPHLLPYSCAKSAIGSLAEGLREEMAHRGVSVTAVHPGLMRTGSHLQAMFTGDTGREYAWFASLAGLPVLSMNAERAAARIVGAVERRRPRLVLTPAARLAARAHGVAPVLVTRANSVLARLLPAVDGTAPGGVPVRGADVTMPGSAARSRLVGLCSRLNERAADRFNQRPA